MFLPECPFFVGIDWAADTHAGCVLDAAGTITGEFTLAHTADVAPRPRLWSRGGTHPELRHRRGA